MKRYLLLITFLIGACIAQSHAQDAYNHAAGVRLGNLAGVSYKRFIGVPSAIEGILGFNFVNGRTVSLTGLYEHHFFLSYEWNLFVGLGITMSANKDEFRLLGEAIAGIEYTVPNFPLNFSLDIKPAYHIFNNQFFFNEYALSIRYVL